MVSSRSVVFLVGAPVAAGHGAMVIPPARNAVEALKGVPEYVAGIGSCPCANGGANSTSSLECSNANACYWFSQGCTIGCSTCDGTPTKFKDLCGSGTEFTLADPQYRTFDRDIEAGSAQDWSRHHPWRSPGNAPVLDPCGMAGGSPGSFSSDGAMYPGDWNHGASHVGSLTEYAKPHDLGSELPEAPLQQWVRGSDVEVAWTIQFNHGGGYQYRFCPKSAELTEACFQSMPLAFNGSQFLRFANQSVVEIQGTYFQGSAGAWAMNPIPARGRGHHANFGASLAFPPPCDEGGVNGVCSGDTARWPAHLGLQIVDYLQVPADLPEGDYVLGWRWDCEESAQVWANCADVRVVPSPEMQV